MKARRRTSAAGAPAGRLRLFRRGPLVALAGAGVAAAAFLTQGAAARPEFDKDRAFKQLEKQVAFGPRVPNLQSHRDCRDYLVDTLKPLANRVDRQNFTYRAGAERLAMSNIIARWNGTGGKEGVLLSAHWDTRPTADYERTAARRKLPIPGANDGASGVAVLLEVARILKQSPPPVPVMIVFFDGEDYGPGVNRMFLGSRYFASNLPRDVPRKGVLLDMVGDKDLEIPQELNSVAAARDVVDEIYGIARKLGLERTLPSRPNGAIEDDHIPLHQKGLKVVDLIDFNYGPGHSWWHTLADTPDKCSPNSLKAVGDVVLEWVYTRS